tara:strand:+ start:199 stop:672 length:474 start_codon:yes stop_codon:yes gene_type:complete
MARIDDYAFDAMNAADPDVNVSGGAIKYSQYEMDMSPKEQEKYKQTLLNTLDTAYRNDPNKGKLSFKRWLKNLKPSLVEERALKWEKIRDENKDIADYQGAMGALEPVEASIIEDAGILKGLLDQHTGRLEDVIPLLGDNIPRPIEEFKVSERGYRR